MRRRKSRTRRRRRRRRPRPTMARRRKRSLKALRRNEKEKEPQTCIGLLNDYEHRIPSSLCSLDYPSGSSLKWAWMSLATLKQEHKQRTRGSLEGWLGTIRKVMKPGNPERLKHREPWRAALEGGAGSGRDAMTWKPQISDPAIPNGKQPCRTRAAVTVAQKRTTA